MNQYTILNLSTQEIVEFTAMPSIWLAELLDVLYTMWELTPHSHRSVWNLLNGDHLIFSFHKVEFVEVWLEPETGRILIRDLPNGWGQK